MFRVNGTLTGASVAFSASAANPLTLTLSTGPVTTSFKAPDTGYYIISAQLNSTTPIARNEARTISFMVNIALQSITYRSEQMSASSIPIQGTNYTITVNFCKCIFFEANDNATFHWINSTGITNSCTGNFSIVRVLPVEAVEASLTCTTAAANQPTVYFPLTVTALENVGRIVNNSYTCNSDGLYFISAQCGGETNVNTTRYTLAFTVNSTRYYAEQFVNKNPVNAANYYGGYPSISKIISLKTGDVIKFFIVNAGGLTLGCKLGKCSIIKLL